MLSDQLRYFMAAARHEHIGRAADELDLSQPALSRCILKLEGELGVQALAGPRRIRHRQRSCLICHLVRSMVST